MVPQVTEGQDGTTGYRGPGRDHGLQRVRMVPQVTEGQDGTTEGQGGTTGYRGP